MNRPFSLPVGLTGALAVGPVVSCVVAFARVLLVLKAAMADASAGALLADAGGALAAGTLPGLVSGIVCGRGPVSPARAALRTARIMLPVWLVFYFPLVPLLSGRDAELTPLSLLQTAGHLVVRVLAAGLTGALTAVLSRAWQTRQPRRAVARTARGPRRYLI